MEKRIRILYGNKEKIEKNLDRWNPERRLECKVHELYDRLYDLPEGRHQMPKTAIIVHDDGFGFLRAPLFLLLQVEIFEL